MAPLTRPCDNSHQRASNGASRSAQPEKIYSITSYVIFVCSTYETVKLQQSDEDGRMHTRPSLPELTANGVLAVIAGSDTTATVLTALFYYLLRHPAAYVRLREEVDATFPDGQEPLDVTKLANMSWLNACMCAQYVSHRICRYTD